jgi:two-component system, OmpR family, phosphate regulon sensor histidine kinase PhoR
MDHKGRGPSRGKRWRWVATHRFHLFFGVSLFALAVLVAWWGMLISRGADERKESKLRLLDLQVRLVATTLGHSSQRPKISTDIEGGERLEIAACSADVGPMQQALVPFHPKSCVRPRSGVRAEIQRDDRQQTVMLVGEAALTVLLVTISGIMLFRMIHMENRSAGELRDLWARVTHELKTPITGLKALIQTLQSQELSREELVPLLDMAMSEVERQERLAENLLVGQRLGGISGQVLRPVALCPWLHEYLERPRLRLPAERFKLACFCQEDLMVTADPNGLRIVFDNLVDNALKYGGDDLTLVVTARTKGDWAEVELADNGPGFSPDVAEEIFRAYRRLADEPGGSKQGTGMGLHIARRLAREMNGDLTASSAGAGTGARFALSLQIRGGSVNG